MTEVGVLRIVKNRDEKADGDDLNDAPYNCNGSIYNGESVSLQKGDFVIILKRSPA